MPLHSLPEPYLTQWQLLRDGAVIERPHARLWPVRLPDGSPAMLKVGTTPEERNGYVLLRWLNGDGAVKLLAQAGDAALMERALPVRSLKAIAAYEDDVAATAILCHAIERLHSPRSAPAPNLLPLSEWFGDLLQPATTLPPLLEHCRSLALALLANPIAPQPLHGDVHHDNVLDGGSRGWLAIDPKGLYGEAAFDYTALFRNPDLCDTTIHLATQDAVFDRRLRQVSDANQIPAQRLLRWIAASAGLSATWFMNDEMDARISLRIAAMAISRLDGT